MKKPSFASAEEFAKVENIKKYQFLWFKTKEPEAKAIEKIIKANNIFEAIEKFLDWRNKPKRVEKCVRVDYEVFVDYKTYVDVSDTKLSSLIY